MRKTPLVICLMMMTFSLSGCLGGRDAETDEGDDIVLENTDDWPTYYVPSASDLPNCVTSILGRLYYVEADTNFQACMSTGWQVVQIGGSSANVVLNQVPIVETNYWFLDDDLVTDTSGNGEADHSLIGLHWDAKDIDGTISQIGIDYDGDNVIDINLPSNSGVHSEDDYTLQNGNVISGLFAVPHDQGLTVHKSMTPSTCLISITRTITVIAIDDGGATGMSSQTMSAINPHLYSPIGNNHFWNSYDVAGSTWLTFLLTTADYDWVMGNGASPCAPIPTFSLATGTSFTTGTSDVIATLTLDSGIATGISSEDCNADWFYVYTEHSSGSQQSLGCQGTAGLLITPSATGTTTDTWVITEDGTDICSAGGTNDCSKIIVRFSFDELGDRSYCMDSINGLDPSGNYCEN
jgi:hypothetical protein